MIPGEIVGDTKTVCMTCKTNLEIGIYRSAAGYYIGFLCPLCGPYSRESGYYQTEDEADEALNRGVYFRV
jgi:hypothetical protein